MGFQCTLLFLIGVGVLSSGQEYHQPSMIFGGFYDGGLYGMPPRKNMFGTQMFGMQEHPIHYNGIPKPFKESSEAEEESSSSSSGVTDRNLPDTKRKPNGSDDDYMRNSGMSHNNFFPIVFGMSKSSDEGYPQGSAIAIANSYSTGKGGVAHSNAAAYGNPYYGMAARKRQNPKSNI